MTSFNTLTRFLCEKEKEKQELEKDQTLLYHTVKIKIFEDANEDGILEIKSLTDPTLVGYVMYENYDDAKLAYDSLDSVAHIIDYMWRHIRMSPTAIMFDKILGDELRQADNSESDELNIKLPKGR